MNFLKLVRILILRNIREEKFLTFFSVIGIALGIGLFVGVKVASDRAITSFESDIRGLNSYANYEILDVSGIDFDEKVYRDVRIAEENSLPVIKTFGYCPAVKDAIDINGVSAIRAKRFFKSSSLQKIDLENFYREINGILVTKKFAAGHSLKQGDTFKALVYDREYSLKIIDILDTDSLLANTVIMDIGNFQEYFDKTGYLSKIDLVSDERKVEEIRKELPENLRIENKTIIFKNQKALVASFRNNLQFVSLIAILVGIFLLYNTVFMTIVKRRTEIGILRGLGADKKTVVLLFTVQGIVLGTIGSILGIAFGQLAAYFSVMAVEKTISSMYRMISISDYALTKSDAVMALLLGLLISLLASAIPAFEASKIRPNESSREGSFEGRYRRYYKWFFLTGMLCILSGLLISYLDYLYTPFAFPVLAYSGILFIIAGFTFLAPLYLSITLQIIRRPIEKIFRSTGKITLGDMKGNIYRFSIALMSVAVSSALIVALLTLIFSLRESLNGWVHKNITADIYVKPASCKSNYCFYPLSEKVIKMVKSYPEVAGVDKFRGMQLDLFGKKVVAGFADIEIKRTYLHRKYADREYERILKEMEGSDRVVGISDYLSIQYGLKKGDMIALQSPAGSILFRINDIFSSYATTAGFIYIDRRWLKKYWGLDDATQISVYLKEKSDPDQFIRKLRASLSPDYSLEIMNNQELREKIFDIFNKTFAITYAIEFISILVSLIGVINTLLALVFERKREISIMRYMGGSWKQIQQSLMLSSGIMGITGIVLGTLLGPLMSIILIRVVNKISFGWEIHLKLPVFSLSVVTLILFVTTLLAGFLPSKVAQKIDLRRYISFE
jgi:putative ABC transport system permease protein